MKIKIFILFLCLMTGIFPYLNCQEPDSGKKLNIIIFGAHPDDPDKAGGTAYKWAREGHNVLMVSLTNGDAGHQTIKAKKLATVRREEARRAGEVIGVRYITLNNHDGQLMPTYKNRLEVIKLIREQNADIVVSPRPYDYHPDHRYTGVLVMDAAYMVTVPTILPDVPILKKNPVFLWMSDNFIHPEPFSADVVVAIDDILEKKIDMYHQHKSQMYEWLPFNRGELDQVPSADSDRRSWLAKTRFGTPNGQQFRNKLIELYGNNKGSEVQYCEAFQDSGYGTRLTEKNLKYYFPFY